MVKFGKIGENEANLTILLVFKKPLLESKNFTACIGELKFS